MNSLLHTHTHTLTHTLSHTHTLTHSLMHTLTHTHTHRGHFPGFSGGSDSNESICNAGDVGLIPGVGPWRREWQPIPAFLSGEFQGQRSLAGGKRVRDN